MNITEYIVPLVAMATWAICQVIKPWINGKTTYLPTIAGLIGVTCQLWNSGWAFTLTTLVTGLFSGLAATGLYEFGKQFKKEV